MEALSLAECARLGTDPRALFYAACRELQAAGETLRKEGLVFRPEEIMESVTGAEARTAAQAVLTLSGISPEAAEDAQLPPETDGSAAPAPEGGEASPSAAEAVSPEVQEAGGAPLSAAPSVPQEEALPLTAPSPPQGNSEKAGLFSPGAPTRAPSGLLSGPQTVSRSAPFPVLRAEQAVSPAGERTGPGFAAQRPGEDVWHDLAAEAARILAQELRLAAMVR